MNLREAYSATYDMARARFRGTADAAGAVREQLPIETPGQRKGSLTIDIATVGSDHPRWVVVISSALHGVEGYFGSAVQLAWLAGLKSSLPGRDQEGRFVLVHGINPYGFHESRRTNENNVDLNRNFLRVPGDYEGAPEGYRALDELLNPASPPPAGDMFYIKALWHIWRNGLPALKSSIAGGQFEFPRGLFYGGKGPAQSAKIIQENFSRWIAGARDVLHIDLHSGLGKYGEYKLLVNDAAGSAGSDWYRQVFGAKFVEDSGHVDATAYQTRGSMGEWLAREFAHVNYRFLAAEFGAHNILRVLAALRAENRAHHYGQPDQDSYRRAKAELRECFCPADPRWRETVLERALGIIDQGRAALPFM